MIKNLGFGQSRGGFFAARIGRSHADRSSQKIQLTFEREKVGRDGGGERIERQEAESREIRILDPASVLFKSASLHPTPAKTKGPKTNEARDCNALHAGPA